MRNFRLTEDSSSVIVKPMNKMYLGMYNVYVDIKGTSSIRVYT